MMSNNLTEILKQGGGVDCLRKENSSEAQKKVISIEDAITDLCSTKRPASLCMADLGCSSGPNGPVVLSAIAAVGKDCREKWNLSEIQVMLKYLPGSDFNTIFKTLPTTQKDLQKQTGASCFVAGVPGSLDGRLFLSNSLHIVHFSCGIQWPFGVPQGLGEKKYKEQFQRDFSKFLEHRSEELLEGGRMVLTFLAAKSSSEVCELWKLLAGVLTEMVSKKKIDKEKMNSFNIPQYRPTEREVRSVVENAGSFNIDKQNSNAHAVEWMEAANPWFASHFGDQITNEVMENVKSQRKFPKEIEFVRVTVSMAKRLKRPTK